MSGLIKQIAAEAGVTSSSAHRIARTASRRYKIFEIPKRKGAGTRVVAQPAREVKALQRALLSALRPHFPVHEAATAYEPGTSIFKNAERHRTSQFLLKLDFANFFPSIGPRTLLAHFDHYAPDLFSPSERDFIVGLTMWRGVANRDLGLCIGAPSSPFLSNTVMFPFDYRVAQLCAAHNVVYTRFSDDLTFSTAERDVLALVEPGVRDIAATAPYPQLRFNEAKRVAVSRSTALHVTGLTLANDGRVTVGRSRKRGVRAGLNDYVNGRLDDDAIIRLKGELAFVLSIEPSLRRSLVRTYGRACLQLLPRGSEDRLP